MVSERIDEQASRGRMIICKSALDLNRIQTNDLHPHLQLQFRKYIKYRKHCLCCLMKGRTAILSGYMYSNRSNPGFQNRCFMS